MNVFRKKENKTCCCETCTPQTMENVKIAETGIKILGSGCAKCHALEKAVQTAIQELQLNVDVEHITDFAQIASYGIMTTPALVIHGKVVSYGKVLSVEEIKTLLL